MEVCKKIAPILVILIFCGIVYSNTLGAGLHYDDSVNIIRNKNVQLKEFTWPNVKKTFFCGGKRGDIYHPILYRPVAMVSFALNYYFHELEVLGYHLVNIAIHMITAIFLFFLIKNILLLFPAYSTNAIPIAFLATLLWAVNPIQVTSVTYITQRMTSMAGMFYVMALFFYMKARTVNWRFYILCVLATLLAIGSKENAIMVPVVILLMELLFFGGLTKNKVAILLGGVFFSILAIYAVSGSDTFSYEKLMAGYAKRDFTLGQRLLTEPRVILFYIMLLIFPSHHFLSLTHTLSISKGLFDPVATIISMMAIALIIGIAVVKAKRYRLLSFCALFFFLNHLIEGTIFPLELIYEHRNYIPSFFFFVPVIVALLWLYQKGKNNLSFVLTGSLVLFFSYNTYVQNDVWQSDLKLWTDTTQKSPDPRSMFNLGGAYYVLKDQNNALKYWIISRDFNQLYGTDYSENPNVIPYGRVMYMATHNAMMVGMLKDSKIRKGWAPKVKLSDFAVIRGSDG